MKEKNPLRLSPVFLLASMCFFFVDGEFWVTSAYTCFFVSLAAFCNGIAMKHNGERMPVSLCQFQNRVDLITSEKYCLLDGGTKRKWLCDIIHVHIGENQPCYAVISIGDIFLLVAIIIFPLKLVAAVLNQ